MSGHEALDFDRVHGAYRDKVLAYATRLVGPDDAQDVAQEVFLKVHRSLGTVSDPARLSAWIHTITLNTVRDTARRRAARPAGHVARPEPGPAGEDEEPTLSRVPDRTARTPEERAIRIEMIACYLDVVSRLPPRYHQVYVLSEFEHLPVQEIASRLSLSVAAVKIRLHRARARLHAELRRHCRPASDPRGELMGEPRDG